MSSLIEGFSRQITWASALIALSVSALCCLLGTIIYNLFLHPLRRYPGPKLWAICQIPLSCAWLSGQAHIKLLQLHLQYGDIVRVAPNQLSFGYPEAWDEIMGHRKRGQDENGKDPAFWRGDILTVVGSDRERHNRLRKVLSHGFSAQAMLDQQPHLLQYVSLLMDRLKTAAAGGQAQEMTSWYNWTTFDMIGDLSFGEPFGCLENVHYHPWVKLIFKHLRGIAIATALIRYPYANTLIKLLTPRKIAKDIETHHQFTEAQVAKRLAFKDARPDFTESMIRARKNSRVSYEEIVANTHMLIVAGSETTATALSGATYLLATNRRVRENIDAELRANFKSEEEIDLLSVQKLDYLIAAVHEALRIFPPVPSAIPRKAPPNGTTIRGEYIPGNTILDIWQWPMFHNPNLFKDPERMIPERWLGDPDYASDRKSALQPFSVGPRNCIGKNLAYAELRLILARLIWNFDLELDHRSEGWLEKNVVSFLWDKPDLYVRLIPKRFSE